MEFLVGSLLRRPTISFCPGLKGFPGRGRLLGKLRQLVILLVMLPEILIQYPPKATLNGKIVRRTVIYACDLHGI